MDIFRNQQANFINWENIMPARNITNRYVYSSGRVASAKSECTQSFESLLEQDFLLLLEYDQAVLRYASQPLTIRWKDKNDRSRRYTPDVLVEYCPTAKNRFPHLKNTLFEVKPELMLCRNFATLKPKFKAATHWCRQNGCRFRIITEKYIQTPYLKNIKFLLQYRKERFQYASDSENGQFQSTLRVAMFELIRTTPNFLLDKVCSSKEERARYIPYIWQLINYNLIGADLHKPLTMESPIWTLEVGENLMSLRHKIMPESDIWTLIEQTNERDVTYE